MSVNRSFESRRTPSIRFFSLSKSLREFRTQESAASSSSQSILPDGGGEKGLEASSSSSDRWADLLPELLGDIFGRVELDGGDKWPNRRSIVAFGCVCRRWRQVTREIVESPRSNGRITFPSCLKQPGPRDSPLQCLIKRDRRSSTFYLYLSVSASSFTEQGKFLLAARRYKHGPHNEYIIALDANDMSQGSRAYMGKLSSDFIGTNFTIYDSEPPHDGAKPSRSKSTRRFASKQISPQVSAGNFEVGKVSYKFNLLKSRGPRRIVCSIKPPPTTHGAKTLTPSTLAENVRSLSLKKPGSSSLSSPGGLTVLRNKAPRWHEHLQCWCLNFHGRVTVASVKNFQLTTMVEKDSDEAVILQFGKVGDDTFTMDFQQPLSAFQAFAICLTSFGTKLACE